MNFMRVQSHMDLRCPRPASNDLESPWKLVPCQGGRAAAKCAQDDDDDDEIDSDMEIDVDIDIRSSIRDDDLRG